MLVVLVPQCDMTYLVFHQCSVHFSYAIKEARDHMIDCRLNKDVLFSEKTFWNHKLLNLDFTLCAQSF